MAGEAEVLESAADASTAIPAQAESTDVNFMGDEYDAAPDLLPASSPGTEGDPDKAEAQPGVSPAEALKPETTPAPTEGTPQPQEGPVSYTRFKEVNDQMNQFKAEHENARRMAEFYQTQYNELVEQMQQGHAPATERSDEGAPDAARTAETGATLPANIKGPEDWETHSDMAAYFDYTATSRAQQQIERAFKASIVPQMQAINKWVGALEEMVVKASHPDFDEVTQSVMSELFVTDHEGKIWNDPAGNPKVKNLALLNYIRQAPSPRMALYDYGMSKRAPNIKADTVKTTTQNLLKAIDSKPKGPTQPRHSSGRSDLPDVLGWDAPPEVVDRYFKEHGIV